MSDAALPQLRVVCEGDTDFIALDAALSAVYGEHVATMVQPERSRFAGIAYTEMGSGWRGVRKWCEQAHDELGGLGARLELMAALSGVDALIVHVDADIADELGCRHPCPPASDTTDAVRLRVLEWGGEEAVPDRVVLCVPAQSTETWVIAAIDPDSPFNDGDNECKDAEAHLCGRMGPNLVRRRSGGRKGYQKAPDAFRAMAPTIRSAWALVETACSEAARFSDELRAAVRP